MAQDETRATPAAPAPKEVGSAAVRTLTVLHNFHLAYEDHTLLAQRLAEHRKAQYTAADVALGALPGDLVGRVRSALDASFAVEESDEEVLRLLEIGRRLAECFEGLLAPYDTMLSAMALQGRQALVGAVRYGGRERMEELKDALRLFKGVLEHPIGARNHAVWFEYGWALLQTDASPIEVEEAFYQAQRLGVSTHDGYRDLSLRYLAHTQAVQERNAEARATLERLESVADAATRIEAARYAVRVGSEEEALAFADAAFTDDTTAAVAVLADTDLAPIHARVAERLVDRTEAARKGAETAGLRLTRLRRVVGDIEARLSVRVDGPEGEPQSVDLDRLGLNGALRQAAQAQQDGGALIAAASACLDAEQAKAQGEIDRLERFLAQALREKSYWEGSLRNIEEEAQLAGFSLHPYTFNNPFKRRKNQRAEQARQMYDQCKANFAQSEAFLASQQARIDSEVLRYRQRLETIADLRTVMDSLA